MEEECKYCILLFFFKKKTFFVTNANVGLHNSFFTVHISFLKKFFVKLPLPGYHNIINSLAAIAITSCLNVPISIIQKGLSTIKSIPKRTQFIPLNKYVTLIDDSYNSNIDSLISALNILKKIPERKILVIGDMKELGKQTIKYHLIAKRIVHSFKIKTVISIGHYSQLITNDIPNSIHFKNSLDLFIYLKNFIFSVKRKTTILFKSSRDVKLDTVITNILKKSSKCLSI